MTDRAKPADPNEQNLVIERLFDTDARTLYEAWTTPEILSQWFFVDTEGSGEFRGLCQVGERYEAQMRMRSGECHTMHGEYRELREYSRIVFTWNSHVVEDTTLVIEIEPKGDRTLLRLTHQLVPSQELRDAHGHGWGGCLDNLERALAQR